jgi:O-antigen ligase/polysaccharide polymerase Wzy-like membrane protein
MSAHAVRRRRIPFLALAGVLAIALITAAVVASQPLIALFLPALLVSAILCVRRPDDAIGLAFFVSGWYGSLLAIFSVRTRPLVDLILGGLWIGTALTYLAVKDRHRMWIWPGVAACMAYLGLTLAETLTAPGIGTGLNSFRLSGWYMLSFILIGYAGWRYATYERMARWLIFVALVVGGYATLRWQIGPAHAEVLYVNSTGSASYNYVDGVLKTVGSFASTHKLAFWSGTMIPFCLGFSMTFRGRWRWLAALAAALCTVALLASGVRAPLAGAVVGVVAVLVLYQLSRGFPGLHVGSTVSVLIAALVVGSGIYLMTGAKESSRYKAIFHPSSDLSYRQRTGKWQDAMRDISKHPFGQGLGTAGVIQEGGDNRYVNIASYSLDNGYLKIAYEQGLVVMIFFVGCLVTLLGGMVRRAIVCTDRSRAGLGIAAIGALTSAMLTLITGNYMEDLIALAMWIPVGIGVAVLNSPLEAEATTKDTRTRGDRDGTPTAV